MAWAYNFKRFFYQNDYKVLVVDDVEENVELIENYLNTINGIDIYKSYSSLDVEKEIREIDFSLIILDIQMPYMDGYELATKIKSGHYGKNELTPIIFVTGIYNSDIDKLKGYNIGSIDYIEKPIRSDEFIKKVKKYLANVKQGDTDRYFLRQRFDNIKKSLKM